MKESGSSRLPFIFLLWIVSCVSFTANAAKLNGQVKDENNQPLPYVIVYVEGTSNGTTANGEGYYSLELPQGTYNISFRMIGFSLVTRQVVVADAAVSLDVQMTSESVKLKEVTIVAGEDPAYEIIRRAQKKRKFYRDQVKEYNAKAYVKSTQQLTDHPKKLLGQEVKIEEIMDTTTKIFYLSESVSELYYHEPDKFKEKMISSKVSGSPRSYSFNQATDVLLSFYDNLVNIGGLTPRGIVSPIAGNSIFYYKFRLEGTFIENGVTVNKISVIPKRINDPVFRGTIYIADSSWRIYSADLYITKQQQIEFVDTFRVRQNFLKVDENTWMPFSHQYDFYFSAFGFKGNGVVLGIFSDYDLTPEVPGSFKKGEVMKVDESANKKDSLYWTTVRPVPLTNIETTDYHRRDSSRVITESKEYLDSVDKKSNKFSAMAPFTGYYWQNSYRDVSINVVSPIQKINFNTVEGWNAAMQVEYSNGFGKEDRREYTITPFARYGFKNGHLNGHVSFNYRYNVRKLSSLTLDAGTDLVQFNKNEPISEMVNGLYSLFAEKNYMKVYEKQYFSASHTMELFNGFGFRIGGEYAHRNSIPNSTTYKFKNVEGREYASNDPYHPTTDSLAFESHNIFNLEAGIAIRPGQEFITRPEGKFNLRTPWPVVRVGYRKGMKAAGGDTDYDLIQFSIEDDIDLGLFGTLKYQATYGDFLTSKSLYTPDLKHFNGNKTWFSDFRINDFKNLEYYSYSTNSSYIEIHAEENLGGFLLNKIPLIRKLKLREIAGIHYLHTDALDQYIEFSIGVEKLQFLRAELFTSWAEGKKGTVGFLIGLKKTFGN